MNEAFGMMDEGYFTSRGDIIKWINDLLNINIQKIEQLGSGAIYCQILDSMYPGKVNLSKVNWKAKTEYDFICNLKILQQSFLKLGIQRHIEVEKLCKCKYQDNLELIQWMKRFYDLNGQKNSSYDAVSKRNNQKLELTNLDSKQPKPPISNQSSIIQHSQSQVNSKSQKIPPNLNDSPGEEQKISPDNGAYSLQNDKIPNLSELRVTKTKSTIQPTTVNKKAKLLDNNQKQHHNTVNDLKKNSSSHQEKNTKIDHLFTKQQNSNNGSQRQILPQQKQNIQEDPQNHCCLYFNQIQRIKQILSSQQEDSKKLSDISSAINVQVEQRSLFEIEQPIQNQLDQSIKQVYRHSLPQKQLFNYNAMQVQNSNGENPVQNRNSTSESLQDQPEQSKKNGEAKLMDLARNEQKNQKLQERDKFDFESKIQALDYLQKQFQQSTENKSTVSTQQENHDPQDQILSTVTNEQFITSGVQQRYTPPTIQYSSPNQQQDVQSKQTLAEVDNSQKILFAQDQLQESPKQLNVQQQQNDVI